MSRGCWPRILDTKATDKPSLPDLDGAAPETPEGGGRGPQSHTLDVDEELAALLEGQEYHGRRR